MDNAAISRILLHTIDKPINSTELYREFNEGESEANFRRNLTKAIEAYQDEQLKLSIDGLEPTLIMSVNAGYGRVDSLEQAKEAYAFYYERIYPLFERGLKLRDLIYFKFDVKIKPRKEIDINQLELNL
ncbi:MAG: hypothetical protein IPJ03_16000 [Ignavibacteriales bacterium]|nr:hypothetical protein [Ignavibacteriales bacterium]